MIQSKIFKVFIIIAAVVIIIEICPWFYQSKKFNSPLSKYRRLRLCQGYCNYIIRNGQVVIAGLKGISQEVFYGPRLIHNENFICPNQGKNLLAVFCVASGPNEFERRRTIRFTWGSAVKMRKDLSIGFVVGQTNDAEVQRNLIAENETYGDVIQTNFMDDFHNVTLKVAAVLEIGYKFCSKSKFIVKIDSDLFVFLPNFIKMLKKHENVSRTLIGNIMNGSPPIRTTEPSYRKYHVSFEEYNRTYYPPYLSGGVMIVSNDISEDFFNLAMKSPYFKIEDALMSGMIAYEIMNATIIHVDKLLNFRAKDFCDFIQQKMITLHGQNNMRHFWAQNLTTRCTEN